VSIGRQPGIIRLRELAERDGVEADLIDGAAGIDPAWIAAGRHIGVTARCPGTAGAAGRVRRGPRAGPLLQGWRLR
jgi:hypothetical protein